MTHMVRLTSERPTRKGIAHAANNSPRCITRSLECSRIAAMAAHGTSKRSHLDAALETEIENLSHSWDSAIESVLNALPADFPENFANSVILGARRRMDMIVMPNAQTEMFPPPRKPVKLKTGAQKPTKPPAPKLLRESLQEQDNHT